MYVALYLLCPSQMSMPSPPIRGFPPRQLAPAAPWPRIEQPGALPPPNRSMFAGKDCDLSPLSLPSVVPEPVSTPLKGSEQQKKKTPRTAERNATFDKMVEVGGKILNAAVRKQFPLLTMHD